MLRDPLMNWEGGLFPYDALAEADITHLSDMQRVKDAMFDLIERGCWTSERRAAWDELRTVENRLWVDFLLYQISVEKILADLDARLDHDTTEFLLADVLNLLSSAAELERSAERPPDDTTE